MKKVIKSVSINDLKKNMILANSIRDKSGNILFTKGNKLDYPDISQIRSEGITTIYIYQYTAVKEENTNTLFPATLKNIPEKPQELANNIDDDEEQKYSIPASPAEPPPLKDVISIEIRKQGEELVKELFMTPDRVKYNTVLNLVSTIVNDILNTDETVISVQDLRDYDNYTYQHSVNLCVLGVTVGKLLEYSEQQLKEFGVGLLFHDFGKTKIPLEILNKPGRLTPSEFDMMKNHSEFGYKLLSRKYKLPEITKMVIRHHHEKLDGSGYPKGLRGKDIPEWVQISTIVDVYDALTADRIYKTKWTHRKALDFLYDRSDRWFNVSYIQLLENTLPDRKEYLSLLDF